MNVDKRRKSIALILVFTLMILGMTPGFPTVRQAYAAGEVLSVPEAIAKNNSGEVAAVEGYVIGHISGGKYDFEADFGDDFNLILADTPTERNSSNLISVQITAGFRSEFGLKTNPSLIGTRIQVTGKLEAYNGIKGLKSPSSFKKVALPPSNEVAPVTANPAPGAVTGGTKIAMSTPTVGASVYYAVYQSDSDTPTFELYEAGATDIVITTPSTVKAYAQKDGVKSELKEFAYTILSTLPIAEARKLAEKSTARVKGVVTYREEAGGMVNLYIQDGTGGIVVRGPGLTAQAGDEIEAKGKLEPYNKLLQLMAAAAGDVQVVTANAGIPAAQLIGSADFANTNGGNALEGRLITVSDVTIESAGGSNFTAKDKDGTFSVYSTKGFVQAGKTYESLTGVMGRYNDTFQLIPRSQLDPVENTWSVIASPAAGGIVKGSTVQLLTPLAGGTIHYTTDGTLPTTSSPVYTGPLTILEDTTIKALVFKDGASSEGYTFTYSVLKELDNLRIHDIQGTSHRSPYTGLVVKNVEGIVTMKKGTGTIYIQELPDRYDQDDRTSEALLVYKPGHTAAVGDHVQVTGEVKEFLEDTYYPAPPELTTTEIAASAITVLSSGNALPAPIVLGKDGRKLPASVIDNDGMSVFDPEEDSLDFFESLEAMRIQLNSPRIIGPYKNELPVLVDNGTAGLESFTPNGGLLLTPDSLNPQRILLDSAPSGAVKSGDAFEGAVTGLMSYNYGNYKVLPESFPPVKSGSVKPEVTDLEYAEDQLTVASYNVENFWNDPQDAARINHIGKSIAVNLKSPDIVGQIEIQDNDGAANSGTTDASANYQALINAIKTNGGPAYSFTDIAPVNNMDGGAPGGNIRVGFLYNPARVTMTDKPKGDAVTPVGYGAEGLTLNPGRIDPMNEAFTSSRKPLAAEFMFKGERVVVIANHFNSKTGDLSPYGGIQPPVLGSVAQRAKIANAVNGFVKKVLERDPNANLVVLGDLNDFQFSDALTKLKGAELTNLVDTLPPDQQYSYVHLGNSQTLDHILVNNRLSSLSKLDIVHMNADFMKQDGRVSDHDPLLAQIDLTRKEKTFALEVLHTNDTHAHLDNVARRVTAVAQERAAVKNSILLDAGDVFSGTLFFNKFEGQADLEFMNMIGYDAMTLGNHEFDKGPEVLATFIEKAKFPIVSANIDFGSEPKLSGLFKSDIGQPAQDGFIYPSVVLDVYGEKVGVFGLTTEDTAFLSSPGKNIKFENYAAKAQATIASLKAQGINKIIALSHLGYTVDRELADQVPGIDIIVGGHSHTKLDEPVVFHENAEPTLIVQANEYSNYLGKLNVEFDTNGVLKSWNGKLLDLNAKAGNDFVYAENAEAKAKLAGYSAQINEMKTRIVGASAVALDGERANVRTKETNLGNLIADGMVAQAREALPEAAMAIQNGGGIRASIKAGDISLGDVLTVMPFGNNLVALKMTGQEIVEALENGVSKVESAEGRFPQVSGLKFFYDSKKPSGSRIVQVQVKSGDSYSPIRLTATYTVVTNAFMADGGDFYASMKRAKDAGRIVELYLPDYDVFTNYLAKAGTVNIGVEGRITDLKGSPLPVTEEPDDSDDSSDSGSGSPAPAPAADNSTVIERAGTAAVEVKAPVTTENGKQVAKAEISSDTITKALNDKNAAAIVLTVSAQDGVDKTEVTLHAGALKAIMDSPQIKEVTIETANGNYKLPKDALKMDQLAAQLGASADKVRVTVMIGKNEQAVTEATVSGLNALAAIEFTIAAQTDDGQSVTISTFTQYVPRTVKTSGSVNPSFIAAVRVEKDANGRTVYTPVPFRTNGSEITMFSRTNSTYLVLQSRFSFTDTLGHWAKADIEQMANRHIVQGTSEDSFQPDQSVTRAEFAALIVRTLGLSATYTSKKSFMDVQTNDWFGGAVEAAAASGIVSGYEDGTFKPNQTITRQEVAVILSRALAFAGYQEGGSATAAFSDQAAIADWASEAVAVLAKNGFVSGMADGTFAPAANATRAESAALLSRIINKLTFTK